jgi:Phosphate-selective porin O and P
MPDLHFNGGYAQASFTLTGELRKYDSVVGAYGPVIPNNPIQWATGGWGAWEIAARYRQIPLNDLNVLGGELRNTTVGVNWYVNTNVRFMFDWIHGCVAKNSAAPAPTSAHVTTWSRCGRGSRLDLRWAYRAAKPSIQGALADRHCNPRDPPTSSLLALADALTLQFRLHVADQRARHPALGSDRRRIVTRTVEVELTGDVHIKLPPALRVPFQCSPGRLIFRLFAGRIDGA